MIAYLILLLTISTLNAHPGCIHDKVIKNQKLLPINDTISGRRLNTNEYGPIRFHLVYNTTHINSSTSIGQNLIKIMNIVTLFWQKTIDIEYSPSLSFNVPNRVKPENVTCLHFRVPLSIINNPVPNADFGIFIEATN